MELITSHEITTNIKGDPTGIKIDI